MGIVSAPFLPKVSNFRTDPVAKPVRTIPKLGIRLVTSTINIPPGVMPLLKDIQMLLSGKILDRYLDNPELRCRADSLTLVVEFDEFFRPHGFGCILKLSVGGEQERASETSKQIKGVFTEKAIRDILQTPVVLSSMEKAGIEVGEVSKYLDFVSCENKIRFSISLQRPN